MKCQNGKECYEALNKESLSTVFEVNREIWTRIYPRPIYLSKIFMNFSERFDFAGFFYTPGFAENPELYLSTEMNIRRQFFYAWRNALSYLGHRSMYYRFPRSALNGGFILNGMLSVLRKLMLNKHKELRPMVANMPVYMLDACLLFPDLKELIMKVSQLVGSSICAIQLKPEFWPTITSTFRPKNTMFQESDYYQKAVARVDTKLDLSTSQGLSDDLLEGQDSFPIAWLRLDITDFTNVHDRKEQEPEDRQSTQLDKEWGWVAYVTANEPPNVEVKFTGPNEVHCLTSAGDFNNITGFLIRETFKRLILMEKFENRQWQFNSQQIKWDISCSELPNYQKRDTCTAIGKSIRLNCSRPIGQVEGEKCGSVDIGNLYLNITVTEIIPNIMEIVGVSEFSRLPNGKLDNPTAKPKSFLQMVLKVIREALVNFNCLLT
ncbi:unnamed protein product [Rodentolepis nana]|uniref:BPI2 domain-containing protein n=1 Tax=Rodentolepis nana TaxID=102285 RepID=A0A0R3T955_RODNA|nr:unnamed protein product [Rodentolepis nana]